MSNAVGSQEDNTAPEVDISFSVLEEHVHQLSGELNRDGVIRELFLVKTATDWIEQAKTRPIPEMLFGKLWYQGELCILFADTNLGKSILAVQIGNSITSGEVIRGFELEASGQPVLYFDFELSDKQFEVRYSNNYREHYLFNPNFLRAEIDQEAPTPQQFNDFESFLNHSLEQAIINTGAKVLIIDNLTYLRNETERAKDALPLMKHLKALKARHGLSILALAHTPKRDLSKPITRNDLQGSKMLINFCDSAFAIGESFRDKNIRYIKQIKARNTEIIYDSENVLVCQIYKPHNFLGFEVLRYDKEREHLKTPTERDDENLSDRILCMSKQGKSLREIAGELGISHMTVNRQLKKSNTNSSNVL